MFEVNALLAKRSPTFFNPPMLIQQLLEKITRAGDYDMKKEMITFILRRLTDESAPKSRREYIAQQILPSLLDLIKTEGNCSHPASLNY